MRSSPTIGLVAPGNALVILDASHVGREGPGPEAPGRGDRGGRRHGPRVQVAAGRRARRLDRSRGARARPDARAGRRQGAGRAGRRVRPARATPNVATRPGSRRWSSTSSPSIAGHGADRSRRRPGARRRGRPGLGLGVHRRGRRATRRAALELLDRLLETTPEPVLLAVLHRRVRELLETRRPAGRRASDCRPPARRWASPANSGRETLRGQAGAGRRPS